MVYCLTLLEHVLEVKENYPIQVIEDYGCAALIAQTTIFKD